MPLTLVSFEIGMRFSGFHPQSSFYTSDPVLGYAFRPNVHGWFVGDDVLYTKMNSQGHHDREHDSSERCFRIAVVGSSYVAGMQVPIEKNFTYLLQDILNSQLGNKPRVQVLNFGCDGYSIGQTYYALRRAWPYHPDLIIYVVTHLDILDATRETAWNRWGPFRPFFTVDSSGEIVPDEISRETPQPTAQQVIKADTHNDLINKSELALAADRAYYKLLATLARFSRTKPTPTERDINPDYTQSFFVSPPAKGSPFENDWHLLEMLLPKLKQQADVHRAELWVMPIGTPEEESPDPAAGQTLLKRVHGSDLYYWDKRVAQMAAASRIHCLRIAPLMSDYATRHKVYLHGFFFRGPGSGHWNQEGNAVAANILAWHLLQSDVFRRAHIAYESSALAPVVKTSGVDIR